MGTWNAQGRVSKRTGFVSTNQRSRRNISFTRRKLSAPALYSVLWTLSSSSAPQVTPPMWSFRTLLLLLLWFLNAACGNPLPSRRVSCSRHENPSDQRSVFSLFFSSSSTDRTLSRMRHVTADWKDLLGGFGRWIGQDLRCEVVFI